MSQHDPEITIVPQLTYDVLQTRHRDRITAHCVANGVDALALLGLYWHMASKPGGWRFSADRLARELGVGRKRVLALLPHLRALGYYVVDERQDADGKWRKTCTFDAGTSWPVTDSDETTTPTKVPLRNVGQRNVGRGDLSISTDLPSTDKSQSQGPPDLTSPRDSKPKPASDEQTAFLDELSRLTDCTITRHSYALTQAQTAIELGHDAASAVDELRGRGHNLRRVGAGFILKQLPTLPYKPAPSTAAGVALVANVLGDAFGRV